MHQSFAVLALDAAGRVLFTEFASEQSGLDSIMGYARERGAVTCHVYRYYQTIQLGDL